MTKPRLWDPCVSHRGEAAEQFLSGFFAEAHRKILLVAAAGFDPRSRKICERLAALAADRTRAVLVREERPNPHPELVRLAEGNVARLAALFPRHEIARVPIFARDGAVIGGREIARALQGYDPDEVSDVVIDLSALSVGVAFPAVRQFFERVRLRGGTTSVHVTVTDQPMIDREIAAVPSDRVEPVHGFRGGYGLDANASASKLWLPQLTHTRREALEKIRSTINPDDICPILPFPASDPRLADGLVEHYGALFESAWEVDSRNLVYADERNPVDLYRSILGIDDARSRVFAGVGGSMLVLSPLGSKALAVGSLLAAMDRDFPVVYMEAIGYNVDFTRLDQQRAAAGEVIHVWLCGEAYPLGKGSAA